MELSSLCQEVAVIIITHALSSSVCNIHTALIYSVIINVNLLFFPEGDFLSCCMKTSRLSQDDASISKEVREGQGWIFMVTLM